MPSTWPFPKPNVPPIEDRLNFIWRNFTDPCDAPVTVWVDTFLPALEHALIAWYYVDLVQIVRTMFTPPSFAYSVRSSPHRKGAGRGRGKGRKGKLGNLVGFDPNAYVGNALSPFDGELMVEMLPGEIWFWTATEAIVFVLFLYSVLDIGSQFFYEWTSAVAKTKYCQARDDAVLLATAPGYPLIGIFGWDTVGVLNAVKERNIGTFTGFGVGQNIGPGVVGCSFSFKNLDTGPGDYWIEARMLCENSPRAGVYASRRVGSGQGQSGSAGVTYDMSAGEVWFGEIRVQGTWQIINPKLFCHATGYSPT